LGIPTGATDGAIIIRRKEKKTKSYTGIIARENKTQRSIPFGMFELNNITGDRVMTLQGSGKKPEYACASFPDESDPEKRPRAFRETIMQ
jgi:hypothetical protein